MAVAKCRFLRNTTGVWLALLCSVVGSPIAHKLLLLTGLWLKPFHHCYLLAPAYFFSSQFEIVEICWMMLDFFGPDCSFMQFPGCKWKRLAIYQKSGIRFQQIPTCLKSATQERQRPYKAAPSIFWVYGCLWDDGGDGWMSPGVGRMGLLAVNSFTNSFEISLPQKGWALEHLYPAWGAVKGHLFVHKYIIICTYACLV